VGQVLLGTDCNTTIQETYVQILRACGFTILVRPLHELLSVIEAIAQTGGKIDAIILAPNEDMSPLTGDPLVVARAIRQLPAELSFLGAVRARTVPIITVTDFFVWEPGNDIGWYTTIRREKFNNHPESLIAELKAAIRAWRQSLIEELEYIGYAVTLGPTGQLAVSHTLIRRRRQGEILTDEASPGSLRVGHYLILAQDMLQEFAPYVNLQYLLNNYHEIARAEGIKPESVFQRFFQDHPHLVQRDLFDRHWAHPNLRLPGSDGMLQPDFVLRHELLLKWAPSGRFLT